MFFSKIKDRVGFLVVGTQKGGTTALYDYLRRHKKLQLSKKKEVHFFDTDENFSGEIDYDVYHRNFRRNDQKIYGECTPIYMYWNGSVERIQNYNSEMKIIIVLRNPITRAFSHWNMEFQKGRDDLTFSEAIRVEEERLQEIYPLQHRYFSYIDRGYYSKQINNIWTYFPKDQVLILRQEDLKKDVKRTLDSISEFLGVSRFENVAPVVKHKREYNYDMLNEDKVFLRNLFYQEIKELEVMLSWDCSDWLRI